MTLMMTADLDSHPYMRHGLLGIMVPYGNVAVEWEMSVLMSHLQMVLVTRLTSEAGQTLEERLRNYFDLAVVGPAMSSFGSTPLKCVGVACTATSYLLGPEEEANRFRVLEDRLETRFIPTTQALDQGLRDLGSKSFHLVSPYPTPITNRCVSYWEARGYQVRSVTQIAPAEGFHPIYCIPPIAVQKTLDSVLERADAPVVVTGTGLSTLPAVWRALGRNDRHIPPILTGNLCLFRSMLGAVNSDRAEMGAKEWFSQEAQWLPLATAHPRMKEFVDA